MPDKSQLKSLLPWGAGASFAVGHMAMTTRCTMISHGQCIGCAGCAIALVSLVSWAVLKEPPTETLSPDNEPGNT